MLYAQAIASFILQTILGEPIESDQYSISATGDGTATVTVFGTSVNRYILIIDGCTYYLNPGDTTTTTTKK